MKAKICAVLFCIFDCVAVRSWAIDNTSQYLQLASDTLVTSRQFQGQTLLQATLTLTTSQNVLFESDGRFYPYDQDGLAVISNGSALDYKDGSVPVQHSFNCIGLTQARHSCFAGATGWKRGRVIRHSAVYVQ